eukprot:Protomagalhaensia_sp_Gyna_25__3924@NODE_352_length_3764_cov_606_602148_g271_i0_p5_GENE_NODE_352_length_3764_cov_606_602148_g271_i0NODE_352_length_3764_cov_606_602148_g271_i0_p5_ORF_typecomplete_len119_score13_57DUF1681/PF07933_14/0_0004_NODE_352_length_3764_cov_606_602148_g271_i033293685
MSITVFQKQGVQIYRVAPPDKAGYHAANWAKCLTLADLQVKLLNSNLTICLRSHTTGDTVEVPVREGPLQRTLEPGTSLTSMGLEVPWRLTPWLQRVIRVVRLQPVGPVMVGGPSGWV